MAKKKPSVARYDWLATIKGKRGTSRNMAFAKTKLRDIKAEIDRQSQSGDRVVLEKVSFEKRRFWTVE